MKFKSRLSRNAGWLIPGLQVKRWLFLVLVGAVFIALGLAILFDAKPISFIMDMVKVLAGILPSAVSGLILLGFGGILFLKGWLNANSSVLQGIDTKDQGHVLERLYRRRMLDKGPKIVAIGGGTGLSTILKGLFRTFEKRIRSTATGGYKKLYCSACKRRRFGYKVIPVPFQGRKRS